ncbi:MAG TPA: hypothetical protein VEM76_19555 [Anaeromyxobacteraceae bacterium]|nr:hypothetical protein [Anaeromyxobacteraceae bacterium]
MLAPRPSATRVAFEEATTLRFGFRRGALAFWLASLVGFVAWGYLLAGVAIGGMPEAPAAFGESAATAVAVGIAGAIALGVPAALLFAGVMRRVGRQGAWRAAVVTGGVLSAALAFAFEALAALVMSDWGYARAPGVLVAAAAAAMMAGAVGGTLAGRRRRWAVR